MKKVRLKHLGLQTTDQSFEKMGALMDENNSKLLGLYNELAMFLSQMNVFRGKGVTDSHEVAVFRMVVIHGCVRQVNVQLTVYTKNRFMG